MKQSSDDYRVDKQPPGATPYEVVYEGGKVKLRRYQAAGKPHTTPLIIVYALIKKPFILDLMSGHSVVENLTGQGFELYLVDWVPPSRSDSWRGFDAYVNDDIVKAVRAVQLMTGASRVSMLGYCFGGLLSLVYAALHGETLKNLITLTTPVDFSARQSSLFNLAARLSTGPVEMITSIYGNCPASFVRAGFMGMTPLSATFAAQSVVRPLIIRLKKAYRIKQSDRYGEIFELFENAEMFEVFSKWMDSDVPLAGRIAREVTREIFGKNQLARRIFKVDGHTVDLRKITCPLLNVIGEYDAVVPPRSSMPLIDMVGSTDKRNLVFPAGHVGVVFSTSAYRRLWPRVGAWLAERNTLD